MVPYRIENLILRANRKTFRFFWRHLQRILKDIYPYFPMSMLHAGHGATNMSKVIIEY